MTPTRRDTELAVAAVYDRRRTTGAFFLSLGGHRPPLQETAGTETSPDIDVEEKLKDAFTRGWSVIVWNDPINLMDYVVYVFKSVLKMNEQDASRHMWEVHQKGKSVVARETREKSELIVHRLRAFGLNATLEKA